MHAKQVCKHFQTKKLGKYHDLYVQSNTLLLAYVFENFRNMCLEIYKLDPAKFLSATGLDGKQLSKDWKELDILTDIDMLLIVEKGLKGGICHSIYRYAKANNKYIKYFDKNREPSYLQYWDVNSLYDWLMSQKLPVNNSEWIQDTSQSNEDFIKNHNEETDEGYFLEADVKYLEKLHEVHNDLSFLPERMKIDKVEKYVANLDDKSEYVRHIRNLQQTLNHGLIFKRSS